MTRFPLTLSSLPLLALLSACPPWVNNEPGTCLEESERSEEVSEDRAVLVEDNSAFSWAMYQQLVEEDKNLFFSPISMSSALDMTRLGAAGDTLAEMAAVLGDSQEEALHHAEQGSLLSELEASDSCGVSLSVANRVFGQEGLGFQESFQDSLVDDYDAPMESLDFGADPEAARVHINDWISEQTMERIPELFPAGSIVGATRLVLANAIWFKGDWAEQFDPEQTRDSDFTLADGSVVSAPMMFQWAETGLSYGEIEGAQLVELPYEGGELSMVLVVPDAMDGLADLEAQLAPEVVAGWLDTLAPASVSVGLPKVEMRWKSELNESLIALGMESAFDASLADFSNMTEEVDLVIDLVIHEAWMSIDEEGTEAAAATGVSMRETSAPEFEEVQADRPYLFLIRDRITDSVLFAGRVADPTAG